MGSKSYSLREVSEILQMSPRTLYRRLNEGILKGSRNGNKGDWHFSEEQIAAFRAAARPKRGRPFVRKASEEPEEQFTTVFLNCKPVRIRLRPENQQKSRVVCYKG